MGPWRKGESGNPAGMPPKLREGEHRVPLVTTVAPTTLRALQSAAERLPGRKSLGRVVDALIAAEGRQKTL